MLWGQLPKDIVMRGGSDACTNNTGSDASINNTGSDACTTTTGHDHHTGANVVIPIARPVVASFLL